MNAIWTSRRPSAASAWTTLRLASDVGASGFSHSTGLSASKQASTKPSCVASDEATTTASTVGSPISASGSSWTRASPASRATCAARAVSASDTATSVAPDTAPAIIRQWELPIAPAPMTPMRRLMAVRPPQTAVGKCMWPR
jgi:hypothetical protein